MPRYAQIDVTTGRCIGVSFLSGEVEAEHMVLLEDTDNVNPGDIHNQDGTWTANVPPVIEPQPDEIALLKEDNANLNLQIIDLWETLIGAGVAQ